MPYATPLIVRLDADGLHGTRPDGTEVPLGVMRDGKPVLLMRMYEDERENCEHCGALMSVGGCDDEDERCGRCMKSHLECESCDALGAEVCIECEGRFCAKCWTDVGAHENSEGHMCPNAKAQVEADTRMFPVLWQGEDARWLRERGGPRTVPWSLLAAHEDQAKRNHGQSLEKLANRGGLSPAEILAVIEGRRWRAMPIHEAAALLDTLLAKPLEGQ